MLIILWSYYLMQTSCLLLPFEDIADKSFPTLVSNKRALLFNDIDLFCAIDVNFASCPWKMVCRNICDLLLPWWFILSLSWNAAKNDTNHQNGKERIRQRKTHQRKKRILNSLNLQIQPKPAKGVRTGYVKPGRWNQSRIKSKNTFMKHFLICHL